MLSPNSLWTIHALHARSVQLEVRCCLLPAARLLLAGSKVNVVNQLSGPQLCELFAEAKRSGLCRSHNFDEAPSTGRPGETTKAAQLSSFSSSRLQKKEGSIKNCSPGRKFAILVGTLDHKLHIFPWFIQSWQVLGQLRRIVCSVLLRDSGLQRQLLRLSMLKGQINIELINSLDLK